MTVISHRAQTTVVALQPVLFFTLLSCPCCLVSQWNVYQILFNMPWSCAVYPATHFEYLVAIPNMHSFAWLLFGELAAHSFNNCQSDSLFFLLSDYTDFSCLTWNAYENMYCFINQIVLHVMAMYSFDKLHCVLNHLKAQKLLTGYGYVIGWLHLPCDWIFALECTLLSAWYWTG